MIAKRVEDSKNLIIKAISTISEIERMGKPSADSKTISYKDAKAGKINVDEFKKAIYALIEADEFLYKKAPLHELNEEEAKEFCRLILKAERHLNNVLKDFGFEFEEKEIDKNALYIVSNKKLFRKLKDKNPDLNVICTEGMLDIEDMKTINPNIPEKALEGIKKKIEITKNNIAKRIEKTKPSKVVVVVEDKADELIYNRAKELYNADKIDVNELLE
ncbi:DUF2100 domain-containing protein [Methanotorris igneus]|uniref:DUF2100 domain-containing protein n=1 Tax=Methanotorris igneus (strain DSM 5666 / JCM 11834 / Kol 5) TaxID=880724 RepID=F6BAF4_METIK|nr:DUF2100 domain-containing protein [Methanotorris igneus]AEF96967.1 Protein of unknown function DUF2100 [Methanotorris igneus Kol 5]